MLLLVATEIFGREENNRWKKDEGNTIQQLITEMN